MENWEAEGATRNTNIDEHGFVAAEATVTLQNEERNQKLSTHGRLRPSTGSAGQHSRDLAVRLRR